MPSRLTVCCLRLLQIFHKRRLRKALFSVVAKAGLLSSDNKKIPAGLFRPSIAKPLLFRALAFSRLYRTPLLYKEPSKCALKADCWHIDHYHLVVAVFEMRLRVRFTNQANVECHD